MKIKKINSEKKSLTLKQMIKLTDERNDKISKEFREGIKAIRKYPKSVTIFGSARLKKTNEHYKKAKILSEEICKIGYNVITGGGPGIMQAGNEGTFESCGSAIGFTINLPYEQKTNPFVTDEVNFHYFFTRKLSMTFSAEAFIYFPGGFGTLDELFEILTLVQTKKIPKVPIVLVGVKFWKPLLKYFEKELQEKFGTISKLDLKLYTLTDDNEEILKIIKKAKLRNEYVD